jgi:hypothetical protein
MGALTATSSVYQKRRDPPIASAKFSRSWLKAICRKKAPDASASSRAVANAIGQVFTATLLQTNEALIALSVHLEWITLRIECFDGTFGFPDHETLMIADRMVRTSRIALILRQFVHHLLSLSRYEAQLLDRTRIGQLCGFSPLRLQPTMAVRSSMRPWARMHFGCDLSSSESDTRIHLHFSVLGETRQNGCTRGAANTSCLNRSKGQLTPHPVRTRRSFGTLAEISS